MTAQQLRTINAVNDQLASDREACELNSRPVLSPRERAQSLASAMLAAKDAGRIEEARALATLLKPLMSYLD